VSTGFAQSHGAWRSYPLGITRVKVRLFHPYPVEKRTKGDIDESRHEEKLR
jgi:hypothetical protein